MQIRWLSAVLVAALLIQACGGSGSPNNPVGGGSSSSSSSSSSGLPSWFPVGKADNLPQFILNTDNAAPILNREDYVKGNFTLANEGKPTATGTLEVRGRGNSTWDWPKKPLRLKFTTATELLGMPANRHWVLLANYADKTLVRNDVAFAFSESLGMAYTPRARHVELVLNGVYQGAYQLTEHLRTGRDRVNIPELKVTDTSDDKISGGYFLEIDFRMDRDFCKTLENQAIFSFCNGEINTDREQAFCLDSTHGMAPFCLASPENLLEPAWAAQREYITNYFNATEAALFGADFTDPVKGYANYLDVDSTINYYIINELFKNVDGARASVFLYKKPDGKLFFGPIWDFDFALGNAGYDGVDRTSGWHIRQAPWFARLFQDPAFQAKIKARWQQLEAEGKIEQILQYAEARALWLDKPQRKNFELWPIFNWETWYTRIILGSYEAEVSEMLRWQRERYQWMDSQLSQ